MEGAVQAAEEARIISCLEMELLSYMLELSVAQKAEKALALARHRDAFVAATAHALLLAGAVLTKRDVYYLATALFGSQGNADAALQRVTLATQCHRNDLNIVAAPKSLVAGDLEFVSEDDYVIKVSGFGAAGLLIPARPERIKQISTNAKFVLVVEKETVMDRLASYPDFFELTQCILISGKGYPDFAARLLLARIALAYPMIPIFMLADADPHGLHIALVYLAALPEQNVQFRYIGIRPSDRDHVLSGLSDDVLLPLEQREITLANTIIQRLNSQTEGGKAGVYQDIATELQYVLKTGQKFEVEALVTLDDDCCTLIEYVKLNVGDLINHPPMSAL